MLMGFDLCRRVYPLRMKSLGVLLPAVRLKGRLKS